MSVGACVVRQWKGSPRVRLLGVSQSSDLYLWLEFGCGGVVWLVVVCLRCLLELPWRLSAECLLD